MAEAHSAVAFSFAVTPEGSFDVNFNTEVFRAIWYSGMRSWKKRFGLFMNHVHNGIFPGSPSSWIVINGVCIGLNYLEIERMTDFMKYVMKLPGFNLLNPEESSHQVLTCVAIGTGVWLLGITMMRLSLRLMFSYHGWMFEPRGKMSIKTKIWLLGIKAIVKLSRKPLLYSYQGALPTLPVPSIHDTMSRYLLSIRPLCDDDQFNRMEKLVNEFKKGVASRLQRYLILKSWWATNYVTDWWEECVYLRGRSPIMVNSNFYGIDTIQLSATQIQSARAANLVYAILCYRRDLDRERAEPIMFNKTIPLCSSQYERQFNTTRIPGIEGDKLQHYPESQHVIVYHKGSFYKVYVNHKNTLMTPPLFEACFQLIINNAADAENIESKIGALTAGDRTPWAKARMEHFSKGVNKASLDAIEKAAFILILEEEEHFFDPTDPAKLNTYAKSMLHGKGYDRWFDKSINLIVCKNGRAGFNAEHSWADAPIMAAMWENCLCNDVANLGYTADGHTRGEIPYPPPHPIKLQWDISLECQQIIDEQLSIADALIKDVDLYLLKFDYFGKGFMKGCKLSPDAFIQMALQLAYYRDAGKFCLTYEASMTRLFRDGRTETVRSCTIDSSNFVKAMVNNEIPNSEKVRLLNVACNNHQDSYKNAMTGKGIDRHLFCLYVVSKYLGIDSPFLKEVLGEPWRLSTSQTPHQQNTNLNLANKPEMVCGGGGFGPVADDGYGVSYIIAGEDCIFFHVSSKISCNETGSEKFAFGISKALQDIKRLFA